MPTDRPHGGESPSVPAAGEFYTREINVNSSEELIEDIRQGNMVILLDDEGRENEGDLVMAAELTRPEDINFMAHYGRGLICLPLSREHCQRLRLPLMVNNNQTSHGTNFTVSIEAAEGVTTGISAADRARTIQTAVASDTKPEDIVQPGHIFPLMAQDGGVLARAGHTEAACDLARLAGLQAAATIVEILNPDGSMARRPDLEGFAAKHDLKIGTIEDLIRYRIHNEKTIERVAECDFPSVFGQFRLIAFQDVIENGLHLALIHGEIDEKKPCPVRVHVENLLYDSLGSTIDSGWPLSDALNRLGEAQEGGVLILLRPPKDNRALVSQIQRLQFSQSHSEQADKSDEPEDFRTYGIGAQILAELGVRKMRLMSAPKVFHGLAGFELEVIDFITE